MKNGMQITNVYVLWLLKNSYILKSCLKYVRDLAVEAKDDQGYAVERSVARKDLFTNNAGQQECDARMINRYSKAGLINHCIYK